MKRPKYNIDEDIGVDYCDEPPWRSYNVVGEGDTLGELYNDLCIAETGQDGDEVGLYSLVEATDEIIEATYLTMEHYILALIRNA